MPRHIFVSTTPPNSAPAGVGHHYVDISSRRSYISIGTVSADDWKASATPDSRSIELTPTNISNNYIDLPVKVIPGSLMVFIGGLLWGEGFAYTVEDRSNGTRVHFIGDLHSPNGVSAVEAGEVVTVSSLIL